MCSCVCSCVSARDRCWLCVRRRSDTLPPLPRQRCWRLMLLPVASALRRLRSHQIRRDEAAATSGTAPCRRRRCAPCCCGPERRRGRLPRQPWSWCLDGPHPAGNGGLARNGVAAAAAADARALAARCGCCAPRAGTRSVQSILRTPFRRPYWNCARFRAEKRARTRAPPRGQSNLGAWRQTRRPPAFG